jgi:hypothetical protein
VGTGRERLRPHLYVRPALPRDVRALLVEELAADVREVERLTGRCLAHWRTP